MSAGTEGLLTDGATALTYVLAGNARLTLVSRKTGARFTYRVRVGKEDAAPHFVAVLQGPNNEVDYGFLGTIFPARAIGWGDGNRVVQTKPAEYHHGKRSRVGRAAPSARAFAWAWTYLARGELPPGCDVYHDGSCGRCGRSLTTPESVASGLGPVCAGREAA